MRREDTAIDPCPVFATRLKMLTKTRRKANLQTIPSWKKGFKVSKLSVKKVEPRGVSFTTWTLFLIRYPNR